MLVQVLAEKSDNRADRNFASQPGTRCVKKATNSGAQRVLDNRKKITGLVELYNLQTELCG